MKTPRRRVVVSGMGVVCATATCLPELRRALREGRDGIGPITLFPTVGLRSTSAGEVRTLPQVPTDRQGRKPMDRASLLALAAAREAFAASGLALRDAERAGIGVCMGTCGGGYLSGLAYLSRSRLGAPGGGNLLLDSPMYAAASRIAQELQLFGGIEVISNGCASGAIAVARGVQRIRSGQTPAMVVGGYDALNPLSCAGFGVMRGSSPSNCIRPFDRRRDGMLLGEGAGVVVLEAEEHCRRRDGVAWAEVRGFGITSDGYHPTAPDPSGRGAEAAIRQALTDAGVPLERVDYINAHGTATLHNDLMESQAARRIFGERAHRVPMSSTKSMIGHTLGAAGAIELIASVVAMNEGFLPPTLNYQTPDPKCDLDYEPNCAREATIRGVLSNSFGFGGANCSLFVDTLDLV